jgi:hypothetical protein
VQAWLTPSAANAASDPITRYTSVPGELMEFIGGALLLLADPENWEASPGGLTAQEAADLFGDFLEDWYASE